MRLLLVEDDKALSSRFKQDLVSAGFAVDPSYDGIDGGFMGASEPYDAIILDLGLPGRSGLEVLHEWRKKDLKVPVLILTARDAWQEKVEGFKAGADDYLAKPFHVEELIARINALLHRRTGQTGGLLRVSGITMDEEHQSLLAALNFVPSEAAPTLNPERIPLIYKRPFSGRYFQIETPRTVLRSRSLWDQELSFKFLSVGKSLQSHVIGPRGEQLLMRVSTYQKQKQTVSIAVTEDLSGLESEIQTFQIRYALLSFAILVLLIFIQRKIVRGGLAPLEQSRRDMASLEKGAIKALNEGFPSEIRPFVKEINRLIAEMEARLKRSRNATGNLAHAL